MSAAMSTSSSSVTPVAPKVSMFGAKSGFVIPKNKLLGSMVHVSRGGKKTGGHDASSDENVNQVQRKTKWGPDLTLDTAVRRGRALAYQTRVDQITEQLKSGILEAEGNQEVADQAEPLTSQIDPYSSELLDLERREAIGEILKLNPSYKAPSDYKPLLKEARVPIPVKEYPGHNFISLVFGPRNETQKRIEKETGVKIRVYGIKNDTGKEVEVAPTDAIGSLVAYEELSVCVTAEAFEKVDAAVTLIELLVTSVTENPVKGDNDGRQILGGSSSLLASPVANKEAQQFVSGLIETPQQAQFQYQGPWIPPVTSYAPQNSGFISHQNPSAPIFNHSTMLSSFGSHPAQAPATPQLPPHPPRNFFSPTQPASAESGISASYPFPNDQSAPAGLSSVPRSLMPTLPLTLSSVHPGPPSDGLLTPTGSSIGWPGVTPAIPTPVRPGNMGPMVSLRETSQGPLPVVPSLGFPSFTPPSLPSGPSAINLPAAPMIRTTGAPSFTTGPPYPVGPSFRPIPIQSPSVGRAAVPLPNPSVHPGSAAIVTPIRPPPASDFTFKVHPSLSFESQGVPRMNIQPAARNTLLPPSPQVPSFRLAAPSMTPQPGNHMFSRPQSGNQISQMPAHTPISSFAGNPSGTLFPPRFPAFSSSVVPPAPALQIQPPNLAGPFALRARNPMQLEQSSPVPINLEGNFVRPNEQFNKNPSPASGNAAPGPRGQQIYDPFSPTSASAELQ